MNKKKIYWLIAIVISLFIFLFTLSIVSYNLVTDIAIEKISEKAQEKFEETDEFKLIENFLKEKEPNNEYSLIYVDMVLIPYKTLMVVENQETKENYEFLLLKDENEKIYIDKNTYE